MVEYLLSLSLLPMVLTIGAFMVGAWVQQKTKCVAFNPIIVAVILVVGFLLITKYPVADYQAGTQPISWFITPATVCLALPLYEQLKTLKKNLPAILTGVAAGTVTSLMVVLGMCILFKTDRAITVSLLPKSITTAMGIVLSQQNGGIQALTATVIIVTGIIGNLAGSFLCRLFRIKHPIAQGVAFGTASHVVGTSKANELSPLTGAVSSLSLATAGILTAILFPIVMLLV